ncbi:MAG TPA: MFS transporter [Pyrinomonadaceae bacterium]|jgi:DHA1 family tetracycline resistance protein-like MFS transporter
METAKPASDKFFTTPLIIIFVTIFVDLIGFGMVIPILPFYANTAPFHASPYEIGFLVSVYSWMQFVFSPILGRLSDKYGRRPILFISLLGSAAGYFLIGLANTLLLVFIGRIISGITGGNISTAQAYVADVTTRENRAKGMGLFGAAFGLGFILGPALAGILSKYGIQVPFYFAAFLSLVNAIALYFILPESIKPNSENALNRRKGRVAELLDSLKDKDFGLITLVYFLLITAFSIMTYAFVLYTVFRFGYNAEQNGYLFAYIGFLAIIMQGALFERLARRFGAAYLAAFGCLMLVISLFAVPFVGPNSGGLIGLLVGIAFFSLGNSLASPALTSLASLTAEESEQGKTLGILQSAASLARAIGPTIGGFLLNNSFNTIDDYTLYRTFWSASGIMFVAFLVALYYLRNGQEREHVL